MSAATSTSGTRVVAVVVRVTIVVIAVGQPVVIRGRWSMLVLKFNKPDANKVPQRGYLVVNDLPRTKEEWLATVVHRFRLRDGEDHLIRDEVRMSASGCDEQLALVVWIVNRLWASDLDPCAGGAHEVLCGEE